MCEHVNAKLGVPLPISEWRLDVSSIDGNLQ